MSIRWGCAMGNTPLNETHFTLCSLNGSLRNSDLLSNDNKVFDKSGVWLICGNNTTLLMETDKLCDNRMRKKESEKMRIKNSLTKSAVVLPCPVHGPIGEYLQLKAGPAVELPSPQDPFQVPEIRRRPPLQPPFNLPQPLVQAHWRLRYRHSPECRKAL